MENIKVFNPEAINQNSFFEQERAKYEIAMSTAKAYPRNLELFLKNAITTVTLDLETAQSCNYALPGGGKAIQGPTVHLAKVMAQYFGNFMAEAKVISIDGNSVTSKGMAYDLETNFGLTIEVKRSIMYYNAGRLVRMSNDMITVTGNAANSIALRNAIFSVIPQAFTNKINREAKNMIIGDISDKERFLSRKNEIFEELKSKYKLKDEEVLYSIGKREISNVIPDDLLALIGFGQAIKDGDASVDYVFKKPKEKATSAGVDERALEKLKKIKELFTAKRKLVPVADRPNIKRIIDNQEVSSYDKVLKLLEAINTPKK